MTHAEHVLYNEAIRPKQWATSSFHSIALFIYLYIYLQWLKRKLEVGKRYIQVWAP